MGALRARTSSWRNFGRSGRVTHATMRFVCVCVRWGKKPKNGVADIGQGISRRTNIRIRKSGRGEKININFAATMHFSVASVAILSSSPNAGQLFSNAIAVGCCMFLIVLIVLTRLDVLDCTLYTAVAEVLCTQTDQTFRSQTLHSNAISRKLKRYLKHFFNGFPNHNSLSNLQRADEAAVGVP